MVEELFENAVIDRRGRKPLGRVKCRNCMIIYLEAKNVELETCNAQKIVSKKFYYALVRLKQSLQKLRCICILLSMKINRRSYACEILL